MATIIVNPGDNLTAKITGASSGDTVYINAGTYNLTEVHPASNVTIQGATVSGVIINVSDAYVIYLISGSIVKTCTFNCSGKVKVIYISGTQTNWRVEGCYFINADIAVIAENLTTSMPAACNGYIVNNTGTGSKLSTLQGQNGVTVTGNNFHDRNGSEFLDLNYNVHYCLIENNEFVNAAGFSISEEMIDMVGGNSTTQNNNIVRNNKIIGNFQSGIRPAKSANDNIISGNYIEWRDGSVTQEAAIYLYGDTTDFNIPKRNQIINNTIVNGKCGIELSNANDNIITGNTISNCTRGIALIRNSIYGADILPVNNTVSGNTLIQCGTCIVNESASGVNQVANNTCNASTNTVTLLPTAGSSDDSAKIQNAIDTLPAGYTLQLNGTFTIRNTIILKSNLIFKLNGTIILGNNVNKILIADPVGGATKITMSGGTYDGNKSNQTASAAADHVIKFSKVTYSTFSDLICQNAVNDGFTLDTDCNNNTCTKLTGKLCGSGYTGTGATNDGNGLVDRGDHNTWNDCIAESNYSDSWVIKCRYSNFNRCIGRTSTHQVAFGLYADRNITNNIFKDCKGYNNGSSALVLNIPSESQGSGYQIKDNSFQGELNNNAHNGVTIINSTTDGVISGNSFEIWAHDNTQNGIKISSPGTGISGNSGSILSYRNTIKDIDLSYGTSNNFDVYTSATVVPTIIKNSSNTTTTKTITCPGGTNWLLTKYCPSSQSVLGGCVAWLGDARPSKFGTAGITELTEDLNACLAHSPTGTLSAICLVGDFDTGAQTLQAIAASTAKNIPIIWVVGNHEIDSGGMTEVKSNYAKIPASYNLKPGPTGTDKTTYSVDAGDIHVLNFNVYWDGKTNDASGKVSIQPALQTWIEANLAASTKPFKICTCHTPLYPYKRHVKDGGLDSNATTRDKLQASFIANGVSIFVGAHTHYATIHQIGGIYHVDAGVCGHKTADGEDSKASIWYTYITGTNLILKLIQEPWSAPTTPSWYSGPYTIAGAGPSQDLPEMTPSQLAIYNGQNGQPTYVAVSGVVYNVSSSSSWTGGTHKSTHAAGQDLTAAFQGKHAASYISSFPKVARLVSETTPTEKWKCSGSPDYVCIRNDALTGTPGVDYYLSEALCKAVCKATPQPEGNGWDSGVTQAAGIWFKLNLHGLIPVKKLFLNNQTSYPTKYPRNFKVEASADNNNWDEITSVTGNESVDLIIDFPGNLYRYIKIKLTDAISATKSDGTADDITETWAIGEMSIYTYHPIIAQYSDEDSIERYRLYEDVIRDSNIATKSQAFARAVEEVFARKEPIISGTININYYFECAVNELVSLTIPGTSISRKFNVQKVTFSEGGKGTFRESLELRSV